LGENESHGYPNMGLFYVNKSVFRELFYYFFYYDSIALLPFVMKALSYSLFCVIFCFFGLCDDEDNCTKLDKEIKLTIYSKVLVYNKEDTGIFKYCTYNYTIDFYKDHCGGEPGGMMSYSYIGCGHNDGEFTSVEWVNTGFLVELTFTHEEDMLNVNFVDSRFNGRITRSSISGKEIYELTGGGNKIFGICSIIYPDEVRIEYYH
jgi:hypothetical protein